MKLSSSLVAGRFLLRLNRFAALVEVGGKETLVHVANSGRMRELLHRGNRVLLTPVEGAVRKTGYDLSLVDLGHTLVSADARLPNSLVQEALREGFLPHFDGYSLARRETSYGDSRIDLELQSTSGTCYVEVKSVTLVERNCGLFPDAPTTRGRRHVLALSRAVAEGHQAAVIFVVQREDAASFSPNDEADPDFGLSLRHAQRQGVGVYAFRCHVTPQEVRLLNELPVKLPQLTNTRL